MKLRLSLSAFVFLGFKNILKYLSSDVDTPSASVPSHFLSSRCCVAQECIWRRGGTFFLWILLFISWPPACTTSSQLFVSPTSRSQHPRCDFHSYQQKCVLSSVPDVCSLQWRSRLYLHSSDYTISFFLWALFPPIFYCFVFFTHSLIFLFG